MVTKVEVCWFNLIVKEINYCFKIHIRNWLLINVKSNSIIAECQRHFKFLPMYLQVTIRTAKFLNVFVASQNQLCLLFENVASRQLKTILNSFGVNTYVQMTRKIWDDFLQAAVDYREYFRILFFVFLHLPSRLFNHVITV